MAVKKAAFTKKQLLTSQKYSNCKDLIAALLTDDKTYTFDEVEAIKTKYLKGKVK